MIDFELNSSDKSSFTLLFKVCSTVYYESVLKVYKNIPLTFENILNLGQNFKFEN